MKKYMNQPDGLYRQMFHQSSRAMLYISSPGGQIMDMNEACRALLSRSAGNRWAEAEHIGLLEELGFPGLGTLEQGFGTRRFRFQLSRFEKPENEYPVPDSPERPGKNHSLETNHSLERTEIELFASPVEFSGEHGLFCTLIPRPNTADLTRRLTQHIHAYSPRLGDFGQLLFNGLEYCAELLHAESAAGVVTETSGSLPGKTLIWPPDSMDSLRSDLINFLETADLSPEPKSRDLNLIYDGRRRQNILTVYIPGTGVTLGCMVFFLNDLAIPSKNGTNDPPNEKSEDISAEMSGQIPEQIPGEWAEDIRLVSFTMGRILERMETLSNLDTLIDTAGILRSESSMGILVLDHEGKILESNRRVRQILSMEKETLEGRDFEALKASWKKQMPRVEGVDLPVSYAVPGHGGISAQIISHQVELCGICSFEDSVGERMVFIMDVSGIRNLEEQYLKAAAEAESAEHLKKTFISSISHEMRTPLNGINGMAQLLEDSSLDSEQENIVKTLRMAVGAMNRLVQDLLDLSRLETGAMKIDNDFHLPGEAAAEELEQFRSTASAKGLKLQMHNKIQNLQYYGDETHIRQIIRNLLSNAIKFTREGFVRLTCFRDRDALYFQVDDSGPGLDATQQEKIFRTFLQLDSQNTSFRTGLGLGLPVARRLALLMEGRIVVESSPGKGSRFTLQLPARPNLLNELNGTGPDQGPDERHGSRRFQGLRAVVAEDDPINRKTIVRFLKMQGCEVHQAENGTDAEYVIRRYAPDIAVLDVSMPGITGVELTRKIRSGEIGSRPDLPILGVTGHALPEEINSFLEAGMNDVLPKPFVTQHLYAKMSSLITS